VLVFLAQITFPALGNKLALHYISSDAFEPYQFVTHMFAHGSISHIFFNMFSLWMFGAVLENVWGPKRFLTFYLACGLGAAILYTGVHAFQLHQITGDYFTKTTNGTIEGNYTQKELSTLRAIFSGTVGASGAVYGLLLAFGVLFPNTLLYIYFLVPIKAKYVVIILTALELYLGFLNNPNDNIAHFAHLGGMLVGFVLLKIWDANRRRFY
jgi:membrane associated rhomboid family serine protease